MKLKRTILLSLAALVFASCNTSIQPPVISSSQTESSSSQTESSSSQTESSSTSQSSSLPTDYFDGYVGDYLPSYSPLQTEAQLYQHDKDVELSFQANTLNLKTDIDVDMLRLFGAFEGLSVSSVSVKDNVLTLKTQGELSAGEGYVGLAKETNDAGVFVTAMVPVEERYAEIDASTFRLVEDGRKIDFTIAMKSIALINGDNLSKKDFMSKANAHEINVFAVNLSTEGYSLEMIEISDDFSAFRLRLTLPEALNETVAQALLNDVKILISGSYLSDGKDHEFHIDLLHPSTRSSVKLYRGNANQYKGSFEIKLLGCSRTGTFNDHLSELTVEPKNKNFIVSIQGYETAVTNLSTPDITTIKGEFTLPAEEDLPEGEATITLGNFYYTADTGTGVVVPAATGFIAQNWYNGEGVITNAETVSYTFEEPVDLGGGTGTVTQSARQSYKSVKTNVEQNTFDVKDNNDQDDAAAIINAATNIGMIGYGLYSGNFDSAKNGAAKLFGMASLADPSTQILSGLASIYSKLLEIEAKIDSIVDQLSVIQAELEQLGQQALLNNYLSAHSAWKAFVTDYYTPLKDAIVAYSNDYFRHYYNLVIDSYDPYEGKEPKVTLNYDVEGNLAFPGRNPALSVDGKKIDKSAAKTVTLPVLHHSLMGIFANNGHVYSSIENDIIVDLFSYGTYDDALIRDVISTIRFNAMQGHFESAAELDAFTSTFSNFCSAFTSSEFGNVLNTTITPLDCYRIMLETVYNFGFEIEPEFNLLVVKIESTYYCARSILNLVQIINAGEFLSSRYDDLDKAVQKEFTDTRFYHSNADDKTVYCYSTAGYVTWNIEAYGLAFWLDGDYDSGWKNRGCVNRGETFDVNNHEKPASLTSIDEASVRLMALKVKLYNNLKATSYNFGEYLCRVGIIPEDKLEKTLGVIISMDGYEDDDGDVEKMKYPANWSIECNDRDNTVAFKGKCYSFADGDVIDGMLCGMTWNDLGTPLGWPAGQGDVTNVGWVEGGVYNWGVWAYYLNFVPVVPNAQ